MNRNLSLMALGVAVALGGCSTSGNTGVPPTQQTANLSQNTLQFAVGTANIAGTLGLNTVVTYRQPNGQDGTLVNTPRITLPFTNTTPASQSGADSGTNTISGSAQPVAGTSASPSTFGSAGGAFAYGFQPDNSTVAGGVSFARYALPIYATGTTPGYTDDARRHGASPTSVGRRHIPTYATARSRPVSSATRWASPTSG